MAFLPNSCELLFCLAECNFIQKVNFFLISVAPSLTIAVYQILFHYTIVSQNSIYFLLRYNTANVAVFESILGYYNVYFLVLRRGHGKAKRAKFYISTFNVSFSSEVIIF